MGRRIHYHHRKGDYRRDQGTGLTHGQSLAAGVITLGLFGLAVVVGLHGGNHVSRTRVPQAGDVWAGCDEAREAGTAPIYEGEPGYSPMMDGDRDGIACEPIPVS